MPSASATLVDGRSESVTANGPDPQVRQLVRDHNSDAKPDFTDIALVSAIATADGPTPAMLPGFNDQPSQHPNKNNAGEHKRDYRVCPVRNIFLCGGLCMTSPNYLTFSGALVVLIGPAVVFLKFTCPFLWRQVHPGVPIMFVYLFLLAFGSMMKTTLSDPGIIPRGLEAPTEPLQEPRDASSGELGHREIQIKEFKYRLKYCVTCKIYRPPRSFHCRLCDNCVEIEDHHCIWLNNCIGRRNYRSFFIFIATSTLLCIYLTVFCVIHVVLAIPGDATPSLLSGFAHAPVSLCLAFVSAGLFVLIGAFTGLHVVLVLRGMTSLELSRAAIMRAKEYPTTPFHHPDPLVNIGQVLCRPQPKSYLRRRKMMVVGEI